MLTLHHCSSASSLRRRIPLLLLLLALLPPLLRLLCRMLIVFVGWLLHGRLRVMHLYLLSWMWLRGPLLLSSPPSIFLMFSSRLRLVLLSVLWWPLVQWCRFCFFFCFFLLFAPSVTAGEYVPFGGRVLTLHRCYSVSLLRRRIPSVAF